jgi:hypothetical protein
LSAPASRRQRAPEHDGVRRSQETNVESSGGARSEALPVLYRQQRRATAPIHAKQQSDPRHNIAAWYPVRPRLRQMASADLSRRVERVVGYPPLSELSELQRREFHEALLDAESFEDLPGKWQAAILKAEQNRPKLRGRVSARERRRLRRRVSSAQACHWPGSGNWRLIGRPVRHGPAVTLPGGAVSAVECTLAACRWRRAGDVARTPRTRSSCRGLR